MVLKHFRQVSHHLVPIGTANGCASIGNWCKLVAILPTTVTLERGRRVKTVHSTAVSLCQISQGLRKRKEFCEWRVESLEDDAFEKSVGDNAETTVGELDGDRLGKDLFIKIGEVSFHVVGRRSPERATIETSTSTPRIERVHGLSRVKKVVTP